MTEPRYVNVDDIVTVTEIAQRFDVVQQSADRWQKYSDFPQPIHWNPKLFDWQEVLEWKKNFVPPVGGRPKKDPMQQRIEEFMRCRWGAGTKHRCTRMRENDKPFCHKHNQQWELSTEELEVWKREGRA